jgi:hypothetical protein
MPNRAVAPPIFKITDDSIEQVNHKVNVKLNEDVDVIFRRNQLLGHMYDFLCYFMNQDSFIRNRLFRVLSFNFNGWKLWTQ